MRPSYAALILVIFVCVPTAQAGNTGSVSGGLTDERDKAVFAAKVQASATLGAKTVEVGPLLFAAQEKSPVATSDKTHLPQLSGTVVDTSGAVIAGATLLLGPANGVVQRATQSDSDGCFVISGLSTGSYRLVVSKPDFETKEIPVAIGTAGDAGPAAHFSGCEPGEHHRKRKGPVG